MWDEYSERESFSSVPPLCTGLSPALENLPVREEGPKRKAVSGAVGGGHLSSSERVGTSLGVAMQVGRKGPRQPWGPRGPGRG